ncbi:MAG: TIR domain-containing protein [Chloroflexi bacterium]|nr:TIR domain-containing protein [Chloroflexota bacterium]
MDRQWRICAARASVINESLIYVSYHNLDLDFAFRLSSLLIRYYRNIWLDRLEIRPTADWESETRAARERATGAIALVSDDFLQSAACRAEFEQFHRRGIAVTAVIARDFSTNHISGFTFNDWVDFRRWFDEPDERSVENLLSQIPQSDTAPRTGERLDYLRGFIHQSELVFAKTPTAWAALRNADASGASDIRPRLIHTELLQHWDFASVKSGNELSQDNLLAWARSESQFMLLGESGCGKSAFARLLALEQAHEARRDDQAALPIWLDLSLWPEDCRSVDAFIESQWPLLSYWRHWLEGNRAFFILENWQALRESRPAFAADFANWIDASPDQRFVLLGEAPGSGDPALPALRFTPLNAQLAQKFAAGFLTLEQQSGFRQILRQREALVQDSQLAHLALGVELAAADRALAYNAWHSDPVAAALKLRSQRIPPRAIALTADMVLSSLRGLAWSMMLQGNHRTIARSAAERQTADSHAVEYALAIGLLAEAGGQIRFESVAIQHGLAAENLKKDGLNKYLTRPEFDAHQGRIARKWDPLALIVVDSLAPEQRARVVQQIAGIDPLLAARCLRRHPQEYADCQATLVEKLLRFCAQNPAAQTAFREAAATLPDPLQTAELLIAQLSQQSNPVQLWLWREICALPLDLPVSFIELLSDIERDEATTVAEKLSEFSLPHTLAYLARLTQYEDKSLRRKALWTFGELKYLPAAILLLDYLERAERDDLGEVLSALMNFAYSEILVRVLRWSQGNAWHRDTVIAALARRKRAVTSRLLSFADSRRLTLSENFYDFAANADERDIALGLAQIVGEQVDLPDSVESALLAARDADSSRERVSQMITRLPNREGLQQLARDIEQALLDPPEPTVIAGSSLDALLYGPGVFDEISAQSTTGAIPPDLLNLLKRGDWQERLRALSSLADFAAAEAVPHLLAATADEDRRVQLAAYEALARFEDDIARKALIAALSHEDIEVVETVTSLLQGSTNAGVDALIELLDSADPTLVAAAISVLSGANQRQAADAILQLVDDLRQPRQGAPAIGQRARVALRQLTGPGAPGDNSREVSVQPSRSGATFSDAEKVARTLAVLRDDDWGRTQKAAKFLRKFARHMRGRDNSAIRPLLCAALEDENWSVRWAAAEALAVLLDPQAIPQLQTCLSDRSWIVQVASIRALVELGAADAAPDLLPRLESSHKSVREAAAEALGELAHAAAIEPLGEVLKADPDEFVRLAAVKSIVRISPTEARPWLEYALSDSYLHIRAFAMEQLAPEMSESDLPILRQLLHDDEQPSWEGASLRDMAIAVLRRLDSDLSRAALDSLAAVENRTSA